MPLSVDEVTARLAHMPGWVVEGPGIVRLLTFASFADAIAFVTRLAFEAEAADHHPDLTISYRKVRVRWTTHSADGVTEKDFAGAAQSDRIAAAFGVPQGLQPE